MPDIDRQIAATITLDEERLSALFSVEENYGVIHEDTGDGSLFEDGTRWSTCTNWAAYVLRVLGGRAQMFGFDDEQNPESSIADDYGGHDFAVVDGRFIVDGWLMNVDGGKRAVFDLQDPDQEAEIKRLYGDRANWEEGYDPNTESAKQREDAMKTARFQEIIDGFMTPAPAI